MAAGGLKLCNNTLQYAGAKGISAVGWGILAAEEEPGENVQHICAALWLKQP